jgi:hypothetical protein
MNVHVLRPSRAAIALVTLAALLTGCAEWKPVEPPYQQALEHQRSTTVRVTRDDGQRVTLHEVVVTPDSVIGYGREGPPSGRTAIALANVREIRSQPTATLKPLAGAAVLLGLAAAAVFSVWMLSSCSNGYLC